MKRTLSLILSLTLCLSLAAPAFAAGSDFVIENGVLTQYKERHRHHHPRRGHRDRT